MHPKCIYLPFNVYVWVRAARCYKRLVSAWAPSKRLLGQTETERGKDARRTYTCLREYVGGSAATLMNPDFADPSGLQRVCWQPHTLRSQLYPT